MKTITELKADNYDPTITAIIPSVPADRIGEPRFERDAFSL